MNKEQTREALQGKGEEDKKKLGYGLRVTRKQEEKERQEQRRQAPEGERSKGIETKVNKQ